MNRQKQQKMLLLCSQALCIARELTGYCWSRLSTQPTTTVATVHAQTMHQIQKCDISKHQLIKCVGYIICALRALCRLWLSLNLLWCRNQSPLPGAQTLPAGWDQVLQTRWGELSITSCAMMEFLFVSFMGSWATQVFRCYFIINFKLKVSLGN